jgi:membrane protease YdiL (CAAX protease family)
MDWLQLLLHPDTVELDLLPTIAVCAPLVVLGVFAICTFIGRLGKSGGELSVASFGLGVPLAMGALVIPEALYVMTVGAINFAANPKTALMLGLLQLIITVTCIYTLRFHTWEMRNDLPRTWLKTEPRSLAGAGIVWALASPLIFATIVLAVALARLLELPIEQQPALRDLSSNRSFTAIAGAYLLAGISVPLREEFAFRLVLFGGLRGVLTRLLGPRGAMFAAYFVSISFFVFVHGMWQPSMFYLALPLLVLSIFLTMLYAHTRSLWPSVILHVLYNSLVLTLQFTLG